MSFTWSSNGKPQDKSKQSKSLFSSTEILKDHQNDGISQKLPDKPKTFSLRGVLGLGQKVEINRSPTQSWNSEFLLGANHLQKETLEIAEQKRKELEREVKLLQEEITKLASTVSNDLNHETIKAIMTPIVEVNEYQVSFLDRLRKFISQIRENISESNVWLQAFNSKKKKKNYFWNTVKNKKKKGGGEQYLFSDEHGVARSVG